MPQPSVDWKVIMAATEAVYEASEEAVLSSLHQRSDRNNLEIIGFNQDEGTLVKPNKAAQWLYRKLALDLSPVKESLIGKAAAKAAAWLTETIPNAYQQVAVYDRDNNCVIIAHRGTDNRVNALKDNIGIIFGQDYNEMGAVKSGKAFTQKIMQQMSDFMKKNNISTPPRFIQCGHSLGAVPATVIGAQEDHCVFNLDPPGQSKKNTIRIQNEEHFSSITIDNLVSGHSPVHFHELVGNVFRLPHLDKSVFDPEDIIIDSERDHPLGMGSPLTERFPVFKKPPTYTQLHGSDNINVSVFKNASVLLCERKVYESDFSNAMLPQGMQEFRQSMSELDKQATTSALSAHVDQAWTSLEPALTQELDKQAQQAQAFEEALVADGCRPLPTDDIRAAIDELVHQGLLSESDAKRMQDSPEGIAEFQTEMESLLAQEAPTKTNTASSSGTTFSSATDPTPLELISVLAQNTISNVLPHNPPSQEHSIGPVFVNDNVPFKQEPMVREMSQLMTTPSQDYSSSPSRTGASSSWQVSEEGFERTWPLSENYDAKIKSSWLAAMIFAYEVYKFAKKKIYHWNHDERNKVVKHIQGLTDSRAKQEEILIASTDPCFTIAEQQIVRYFSLVSPSNKFLSDFFNLDGDDEAYFKARREAIQTIKRFESERLKHYEFLTPTERELAQKHLERCEKACSLGDQPEGHLVQDEYLAAALFDCKPIEAQNTFYRLFQQKKYERKNLNYKLDRYDQTKPSILPWKKKQANELLKDIVFSAKETSDEVYTAEQLWQRQQQNEFAELINHLGPDEAARYYHYYQDEKNDPEKAKKILERLKSQYKREPITRITDAIDSLHYEKNWEGALQTLAELENQAGQADSTVTHLKVLKNKLTLHVKQLLEHNEPTKATTILENYLQKLTLEPTEKFNTKRLLSQLHYNQENFDQAETLFSDILSTPASYTNQKEYESDAHCFLNLKLKRCIQTNDFELLKKDSAVTQVLNQLEKIDIKDDLLLLKAFRTQTLRADTEKCQHYFEHYHPRLTALAKTHPKMVDDVLNHYLHLLFKHASYKAMRQLKQDVLDKTSTKLLPHCHAFYGQAENLTYQFLAGLVTLSASKLAPYWLSGKLDTRAKKIAAQAVFGISEIGGELIAKHAEHHFGRLTIPSPPQGQRTAPPFVNPELFCYTLSKLIELAKQIDKTHRPTYQEEDHALLDAAQWTLPLLPTLINKLKAPPTGPKNSEKKTFSLRGDLSLDALQSHIATASFIVDSVTLVDTLATKNGRPLGIKDSKKLLTLRQYLSLTGESIWLASKTKPWWQKYLKDDSTEQGPEVDPVPKNDSLTNMDVAAITSFAAKYCLKGVDYLTQTDYEKLLEKGVYLPEALSLRERTNLQAKAGVQTASLGQFMFGFSQMMPAVWAIAGPAGPIIIMAILAGTHWTAYRQQANQLSAYKHGQNAYLAEAKGDFERAAQFYSGHLTYKDALVTDQERTRLLELKQKSAKIEALLIKAKRHHERGDYLSAAYVYGWLEALNVQPLSQTCKQGKLTALTLNILRHHLNAHTTHTLDKRTYKKYLRTAKFYLDELSKEVSVETFKQEVLQLCFNYQQHVLRYAHRFQSLEKLEHAVAVLETLSEQMEQRERPVILETKDSIETTLQFWQAVLTQEKAKANEDEDKDPFQFSQYMWSTLLGFTLTSPFKSHSTPSQPTTPPNTPWLSKNTVTQFSRIRRLRAPTQAIGLVCFAASASAFLLPRRTGIATFFQPAPTTSNLTAPKHPHHEPITVKP